MNTGRRQRRRFTAAFTLLELLVVMAIVGILAGLLLPVLAKAKGKAKDAKCLSNLKQIGVALTMYADDNKGKLPYAERRPSTPIETNHVLPRIVDVLSNNVGGVREIFHCPKDLYGWFQKEGSSYEWNYAANGKPIELPGVIQGLPMTAVRARLIYDYENFHPGFPNGTKNVLYGDGHAAPIK